MEVEIENVRSALKGDASGLFCAFDWSEHEFGYDYWDRQDSRLRADKPLKPKARKEIERLIAEHEAPSKPERTFSVGDRVRRSSTDVSGGIKFNEEGIVEQIDEDAWLFIKGWWHDPEEIEVVPENTADDKPKPPVLMSWADVPEGAEVIGLSHSVAIALIFRKKKGQLQCRHPDTVWMKCSDNPEDLNFILAPIPAEPEPETMPWDDMLYLGVWFKLPFVGATVFEYKKEMYVLQGIDGLEKLAAWILCGGKNPKIDPSSPTGQAIIKAAREAV